MLITGGVFAVLGTVAFIVSLLRTLRANPEHVVPFNRNPPVLPAGSVTLRSISMGLIVFSAALLSPSTGAWSIALLLIALIFAVAAITRHNRRVTARTAPDPATTP